LKSFHTPNPGKDSGYHSELKSTTDRPPADADSKSCQKSGFENITHTKAIMRHSLLTTSLILAAIPATAQEKPAPKIMVGHLCATSPLGMAMVVNDRAALFIEPQFSQRPKNNAEMPSRNTAPDGSFLKTTFKHREATITLTWGKCGPEGIMAVMTTDKLVELALRMQRGWMDFPAAWKSVPGGVDGYPVNRPDSYLPASVRTDPAIPLIG
jgi:hypothetical protein